MALHRADIAILDRAVKGYAGRMTSVEELGPAGPARPAGSSPPHRPTPRTRRCSPPLTCCSSAPGRSRPPTRPISTAASAAGMAAGPLDRLRLTDARLEGMAGGLRTVAGARRPDRRRARRLDAAQRPADHARARAARCRRDHLREPAERDERRGRAVPEVGQRGVAARLVERVAVERRDRVGAARGAREARAAGRRGAARRGHRVRDRDRR